MFKTRNLKFILKNLRKKNRYTQATVAQKLGISTRAYAKIEAGDINLTVERLHKLSTIFNVDITYFLEYENNKQVITNNLDSPIALLKHYQEAVVLLKEQNEMLRVIINKQLKD